MKFERVSEHIWTVKARMMMVLPVRVWLVVAEDGVTLVDTGFSAMGKGILNYVAELNAGPLRRILLTHGHSDHAGSVDTISVTAGVPVFAHEVEIPYINGELPYPRRKKAEASVQKSLVQPLPTSESDGLTSIAGLTPYFTPGHSPGHVAFYHEADNVLLAGDMFTSKNGRLRRPMPMFTADMEEALKSSFILRQVNPVRVEVCHGNPVLNASEQLNDYLRTNGLSPVEHPQSM